MVGDDWYTQGNLPQQGLILPHPATCDLAPIVILPSSARNHVDLVFLSKQCSSRIFSWPSVIGRSGNCFGLRLQSGKDGGKQLRIFSPFQTLRQFVPCYEGY